MNPEPLVVMESAQAPLKDIYSGPKVDPEAFAREAYREYRRANRPFRRAFPGGERRRKILLAVGRHTAARKEA